MKTLIIIIINVFVLIMLAVMVFYTVSGEVSLSFAKAVFCYDVYILCVSRALMHIYRTYKQAHSFKLTESSEVLEISLNPGCIAFLNLRPPITSLYFQDWLPENESLYFHILVGKPDSRILNIVIQNFYALQL